MGSGVARDLGDFHMRTSFHVAAAVSALLALLVTPALAASTKDMADCEQMTNPTLKISACTRILQSGKPASDAKAAAWHHRGVGYLLQQNFDRAIVEFNEALRTDPAYKRSYNSRGNAWKGKGETRSRAGRLQRGDPPRSGFCVSLQRPRQRLVQPGRVRIARSKTTAK